MTDMNAQELEPASKPGDNRRQRPKIVRIAEWFLISVLATWFALLGFAVLLGDKVLFPAPAATYVDGPDILKIPTADGSRISARYLHNPQARYTILYSHGNGEDIALDRSILEALRDHGFSVFAYDYRGYGTSGGKASEENACADVEAAYHYLVGTLRVPPGRIIAHGRSLGGAMAVHLASRESVAGLIIESTFLSAFRVVTQVTITPWDKFPNVEKIRQVRCPILVMHGKYDTVIPYWHARGLYEAATASTLHYLFKSASHDPLVVDDAPRYWNLIDKLVGTIQRQERTRPPASMLADQPRA